jgi:hypothetical protein
MGDMLNLVPVGSIGAAQMWYGLQGSPSTR